MNARVRIITIAGIPVLVHASWLVVYALLTWSLAVGYFPRAAPDLPPAAYWITGLIASLLLFVSVLLHELSHSVVARRQGLHVRGITLHVFGGVSELEDEPSSPGTEFLVAVVGPITSFVIAGLAWALAAALDLGGSVGAILQYLATVNIVVGVFNLVPGFPLDGGRLLRAALWRWSGSLEKATAIAARCGMAVAFGLIGVGVLQFVTGHLIGGMWLALIGLFLRAAARTSHARVALRDTLAGWPVNAVMAREVVTIPIDATAADLVDLFWTHHVGSFPVMDGSTVRGIVTVGQAGQVQPDQRDQLRVKDIMRPLDRDLVVAPTESIDRALERGGRNGVGRLAVIEGAALVGYLSLKDITHVLTLGGPPASRSDRSLRRAA
jgi:Zn-dependent protease/predicted transcriptional regulator